MFSFNIRQIFLEQYFCQLIEYYTMLTNTFFIPDEEQLNEKLGTKEPSSG